MTVLVACLSSGKGSWSQVAKLANCEGFEKVYLVTNDFGDKNFTCNDKSEKIVLDTSKVVNQLVRDVVQALTGKISDTEVALNLTSGSGKEHMALISALLKLGLGVRLVVYADGGVVEV
jgi:hypothetical protein